MFRYHALGGVSAIAIQAALLALPEPVHAQTGKTEALPAITVDAPQALPHRATRKPSRQAAAARRRTTPVVAAEQNRANATPGVGE